MKHFSNGVAVECYDDRAYIESLTNEEGYPEALSAQQVREVAEMLNNVADEMEVEQ